MQNVKTINAGNNLHIFLRLHTDCLKRQPQCFVLRLFLTLQSGYLPRQIVHLRFQMSLNRKCTGNYKKT